MDYDTWKTTPPDDSGEVEPECESCGENVHAVNAAAICAACEREIEQEKVAAEEAEIERRLENVAQDYFDEKSDRDYDAWIDRDF